MLSGELQASDRVPLIYMSLRGILWIVKCSYTLMRRLTKGIRSEICVLWRFRRSAKSVYLHKPRQYSPVMGNLFKEGAKGKEKNFRLANIIY